MIDSLFVIVKLLSAICLNWFEWYCWHGFKCCDAVAD